MPEAELLTKSERTKDSILRQALGLFQEQGFEAVTMRDLAKACGLSLGAFYYHFASKEEIVLELFKTSFDGHFHRTQKHLETSRPSLELTMAWICRDRFKEFDSYRGVLRVLVQRLDPQDPVSPWHESSRSFREQSVLLFEKVVATCLTKVDGPARRRLARALWLQHLLILGVWSFDRSPNQREAEAVLKQSSRLWKKIPYLLRVPGMKALLKLVLSPLEGLEKSNE
jgi:AcrR family transcriptional regulator